ncbi:MAG: hypothetical protein LBR56_00220 [Sporomusaceae bacterium]|nr:hypothetical protein [Sporomusaceae bacterium]
MQAKSPQTKELYSNMLQLINVILPKGNRAAAKTFLPAALYFLSSKNLSETSINYIAVIYASVFLKIFSKKSAGEFSHLPSPAKS